MQYVCNAVKAGLPCAYSYHITILLSAPRDGFASRLSINIENNITTLLSVRVHVSLRGFVLILLRLFGERGKTTHFFKGI